MKELGDNNRAIRRSAANADTSIRPTVVVCSLGRRQRKEEEEVKMFLSEGDLSSSLLRHATDYIASSCLNLRLCTCDNKATKTVPIGPL